MGWAPDALMYPLGASPERLEPRGGGHMSLWCCLTPFLSERALSQLCSQ